MLALKVKEQTVQLAPDQQVSLTNPDPRSMATSGRGTATVGYNVQTAVDTEHHLIIAHEVINRGYDPHQLAPMAFMAQQATGREQITVLADRAATLTATKVRTEMSLHVLAYNLKRMISIFGVGPLIAVIRT